jgi:hypothetical protein
MTEPVDETWAASQDPVELEALAAVAPSVSGTLRIAASRTAMTAETANGGLRLVPAPERRDVSDLVMELLGFPASMMPTEHCDGGNLPRHDIYSDSAPRSTVMVVESERQVR